MPSSTSALVIANEPALPVSAPPPGVEYTPGSNSRVRLEYWLSGTNAVQASPTASAPMRRDSTCVPRHTPTMKQTSATTNANPARARTVSMMRKATLLWSSGAERTSNSRVPPNAYCSSSGFAVESPGDWK